MNGLGTLIILGIVMYFLFSKGSGMGCCGGHSDSDSHHREPEGPKPQRFPENHESAKVIDLKPEEYEVISVDNRKI